MLDLYHGRQHDGSDFFCGLLRSVAFKPAARDPVQKQYEALSYAWGPTHEDGFPLRRWIVSDLMRLPVTAHLHRALARTSQDAASRNDRVRFTTL